MIKLAHHAEKIALVGTLSITPDFLPAETHSDSSPLWVKETGNDASGVSSASGVIVLFTSQFNTRIYRWNESNRLKSPHSQSRRWPSEDNSWNNVYICIDCVSQYVPGWILNYWCVSTVPLQLILVLILVLKPRQGWSPWTVQVGVGVVLNTSGWWVSLVCADCSVTISRYWETFPFYPHDFCIDWLLFYILSVSALHCTKWLHLVLLFSVQHKKQEKALHECTGLYLTGASGLKVFLQYLHWRHKLYVSRPRIRLKWQRVIRHLLVCMLPTWNSITQLHL